MPTPDASSPIQRVPSGLPGPGGIGFSPRAQAEVGVNNLTNATAIGNGAIVDFSNKVILGNTAVTSIGGQVGFTTFSDRRLKKDIRQSELGLEFIQKLNPVTYEYIAEGQKGIRYNGLIAQEVDAAANGQFSGVDKNGEYWGIRYAELTVPIIKAIQELAANQTDIQTIKAENTELKTKVEMLSSELAEIKAALSQFSTDLQSCCLKETNLKTPQTIVINGESPVLEQNIPNPFSQSTTIQYYIPKRVKTAVMQITDVNGNLIQTAEITARGADSILIQTGNLSQGTYFYSLILDGKVFETKKMMISSR